MSSTRTRTSMYENPYQSPQSLPEIGSQIPAAGSPLVAQPRIWTVFAALATAFGLSMAVGLIVGIAWAVVLIQSGRSFEAMEDEIAQVIEDPINFILLTAMGQLPFLITPLVAAWLSPVPFARRLGLTPTGLNPLQFAVVVCGAAASFALGLGASYGLAQWLSPDESTDRLYDNITWGTAIPFIAFIALMPALAEELLFRGYMQRRLLQRWSPWAAILVTSTCFALVHMDPQTIVFAFPLGVWLGWVASKTGSIWPCIATHAAVNGTWNAVVCGMRLTGVETLPPVLVVALGILGLAATAWAVLILRNHVTSPPAELVASYATVDAPQSGLS